MGLEKISELKKKMGLTTEELSKLSGVPKGTLDKILSGITKDPKLETLRALARVLNCSLDDFNDDNNLSKNNISDDEPNNNLLHKYNSLDSKGKHTVNTILNVEYERCVKEKEIYLFAAHTKEGVDVNSDTYEEDNLHDINIMLNDDEWK